MDQGRRLLLDEDTCCKSVPIEKTKGRNHNIRRYTVAKFDSKNEKNQKLITFIVVLE
jgi:hypothetical protein